MTLREAACFLLLLLALGLAGASDRAAEEAAIKSNPANAERSYP